jgi:hypothetical protein
MPALKRTFIYLFIIGALAYAGYFIFTGISLPFYADELGGYGAAIRHQVENGISLSPNATPYKYTFGHPQMHTVVMAPLAHIFGFNPLGLHTAALILTLIGIGMLAFYFKKYYAFKRMELSLLITMLLVQPVFLTQSYMVHSEMLLLIWMGLAILFAWHKKYLAAALITSLAVLTKETGMFLVCLLPCIAIYHYYKREITAKRMLGSIAYLTLPVITFLTFIWVQNEQMGFYLSPTNLGKTTSSLDGFYHKFIGTLRFVFFGQNRFLLTGAILIYTITKKRKEIILYLKMGLFLIVSFCLASAILSHPIERYLIFPVVVWVLIFSIIFIKGQSEVKWIWALTCLALVLNVGQWDMFRSDTISDADLSYRQNIENTEQTIAYMNAHDISPVVLEFPYNFSQEYDHSGYTKLKESIQILKAPPKTKHYRVFSWPGNLEHENDTQGYQPIVRMEFPYSFSELSIKD